MIAELFYLDTTIQAKTPYVKAFVTAMKDKIPKDYRYWDNDDKVWVVNYSYEVELLALCSAYFDDVVQYGQKRYSNTTVATTSPPEYETLFLLPTAPKEVVLAAYRVLSKLYHPDVSKLPDANEKMKKVNIAFDEIMGRR